MKPFTFILTIFSFCLNWHTAISTQIYVTPIPQGCAGACAGTLVQPFDNLIFALLAAQSITAPQIVVLNSNIANHYVLAGEKSSSSQSLLYNFTNVVMPNFTTLTIKPLFCDEMTGLSLPANTYCINRTEKVTLYMKTLRLSIGVKVNFTLQNILFDGIEAISDYNSGYYRDMSECTYQRKRCCPSTDFVGTFNNSGSSDSAMIQTRYLDYNEGIYTALPLNDSLTNPLTDDILMNQYRCNPSFARNDQPLQEGFFRFYSPLAPRDQSYQQISFLNTDLQNFWGKDVRSFIQVKNSSAFTLTLNNCTIDDILFKRGLTYVDPYTNDIDLFPGAEQYENIAANEFAAEHYFSQIIFSNLNFSNYNRWPRYKSSIGEYVNISRDIGSNFYFSEGYLLLVTKLMGSIRINNSTFQDMNSLSQRMCVYLPLYPVYSVLYGTSNPRQLRDTDTTSMTNLYNMSYDDTQDIYVSSLVYIQQINGELNVQGSNFERIKSLKGSVIRIDGYLSYLTTTTNNVTIQDSVFQSNAALYSYANILIKGSERFVPCPIVNITNSQFLNSTGCPGSYGNVGLLCIRPDYSPYSQTDWNPLYTLQITVRDSVFQNNLLGLSNSLAIIGTFATYLNNNVFQDNGGVVGEELIQYSLGLSQIPRDPMDLGAGPSYFGQSTAVYIGRCFKLRVNKTTFQGNWGPFQGSQVLGSSLTLLNITNDIVFEDSQFTDHNGVPSIINPDVRDGLNYYSPPIITIDNAFVAFDNYGTSAQPIFRRVDFINNNAKYGSFLGTCSYIYNTFGLSKPLVYLIENNLRFRSGFLKFLTPSEVADTFSVQNTLDSSSVGDNVLFSDGKIANNTLSSGCMFSNARLKTFVLRNLTIEGNQINPAVEGQRDTIVQDKSSTDNIEATRSAIFCGYQKSAMTILQTLLFNADKLKAKNNVGPIFNLFPDEQNYLSLTNSLFINNTCEGTSSIISFEDSQVYSSNNIFIDNTNAYGIVFTTASSYYSSALTSYLRNDGRHATLIYAKDRSTAWQASSKVYWNKVSPAAYLFAKTNILQGGLYYLSSAELMIQNANFIENQAYGGLVISSTSSVSFNITQFINHTISGTGLIGNFGSGSSLVISLTNLTNNSITDNPLSSLQPSLITVTASNFELTDIIISNSSKSNLGAILTGIQANGALTNTMISNFEMLNETGLFSLLSSNATITNLQADNITSLFGLYNTILDLSSIIITRLHKNTGTLFLMNTIASTLKISQLEYTGGSDGGSYLSLIVGFTNKIIISETSFLNAVNGENNKIFDLKENSLFSIMKSTFTHTSSGALPTIFAFESGQTVRIEQCAFIHTGQLIQDENTGDGLYFVSNTILASPYIQKIVATGDDKVYILDNQFLMSQDAGTTTTTEDLSSSQINIVDSSGLTQLHNNVFLSLCGSVGIVQVQAKNTPYQMESIHNIFINNTGTLGGALHLDASFSPNEANNTSNASIDSSVFLLNRVSKVGDSTGKGGALYQTTPTLIVQNTSISNSTFIQNTAEITGGAIYFDYLPPDTDANSEFWNNSANNNPNHIGSYPVKLVYYTQQPNISRSVALPSDAPSRVYAAYELYHWENVSSGLASTENCTFILLDMFDQLIETDNSSVLEVYPSGLSKEQRYTFSNKLSVTAVNGSYTYNDFTFTYKTNGTINVMFTSSAIQSSRQIPLKPSSLPVIDDITIEVHFRQCGKGEYVVTNGDTKSCRACQPGFWQPGSTPDATSCQACDSASTVCLGGTRVGVKQDYWRLNDTSDIVNQCPVTGACLGEESEESRMLKEQCAYGYRSNLCAKCITGWAKTTSGACVNCQTDVWYYVRVLLVLLFQLAIIINAIRGTIVISKESDESQKLKLNNAVLIRILTNYLQLISLVTSIPVTWPNDIKSIFSTSTQVLSITGNVFTLDCLFWSDDVSGIKVVYIKTLMNTVGPFGLIILGILANIIYFKIKRTRILRNKAFMNRSISIAIVICFMAQTSAIQSAFALFRCENLYRTDDPVYYLVKDFEVQCWEGTHLYWALGFGLPMLILWAIVLPSLIYNALRKKKNALKSEGNLQKYSFLYGGYNDNKYYWELVIMIRKFLLIGVLIAASFQSPNLQIYFSILLIIFWYVLQFIAHPYADPNLNKLEQLSLIGAGIVSFCQLYFKFISSIPVLGTIVLVWCFIGNIIFFLYFASLYFAFQIEQLRHNKAVTGTMKKFKCLNSTKLERMITRVSTLMERLGLSHKRTSETRTQKTEEKDIDLKTRPLDTHCFSPLAMLSARTKSFEKITSREPEENLPYEEQPSLSSPDDDAPDEDAPSLPQSLKQIELEEPQDKSMIAEKVTLGPDLGIKLIGQKKKCLTMVKGFQEASEDV